MLRNAATLAPCSTVRGGVWVWPASSWLLRDVHDVCSFLGCAGYVHGFSAGWRGRNGRQETAQLPSSGQRSVSFNTIAPCQLEPYLCVMLSTTSPLK